MSAVSASFLRTVRRFRSRRKAAIADLELGIDARWYVKTYPDVEASGMDPIRHFIALGAWEGRQPNRFFEPIWYVQRYPEAAGQLPILHYALVGRQKRHDPGPNFSVGAYIKANPDVAANGFDPLDHFIRHGQYEQRAIAPADVSPKNPAATFQAYQREVAGPRFSDTELAGGETAARVRLVFWERRTEVGS